MIICPSDLQVTNFYKPRAKFYLPGPSDLWLRSKTVYVNPCFSSIYDLLMSQKSCSRLVHGSIVMDFSLLIRTMLWCMPNMNALISFLQKIISKFKLFWWTDRHTDKWVLMSPHSCKSVLTTYSELWSMFVVCVWVFSEILSCSSQLLVLLLILCRINSVKKIIRSNKMLVDHKCPSWQQSPENVTFYLDISAKVIRLVSWLLLIRFTSVNYECQIWSSYLKLLQSFGQC